jgi:hypothetical protein
MEYEAYIAGANFSHLAEMEPEKRAESLDAYFGFLVAGSVNHWYRSESKKRNEKVTPEWDDPKYFE